MDKATYAAASAGMAQLARLELINNNLANVSTPGFKGQYLLQEQQEFEDTLASQMGIRDPYGKHDHDRTPGVQQVQSVTDFTPGPIERTGDDLHVALRDANDFFVINTPDGPQFSRAGNFTLDDSGRLVSQDGMPVSGDGDSITAQGGVVSITSGGFVKVNGEQVGRIQVMHVENPETLERVGHNRFRAAPDTLSEAVAEPNVIPKSLEMANVSAVQAMVDLIATSRGFERCYTNHSREPL